nr:uncharacterized protein LOC124809374 [Hydra vulgaris]
MLNEAEKQVRERGICDTLFLNNGGIRALSIIHLKVNGLLATAMVDADCYSVCGQLLGHLSVCDWLRVVCSLLKDPPYGDCAVHGDERNVWVDASYLASGAVIQVGKTTVEDATRLRKEMSEDHINMVELDAVMREMNMALTWKLTKVTIFRDSVTVFYCVSDALTGKSRLKSKAMGEMSIRRRSGVLRQCIEEYSINVIVKLVPSKDNLADALTRVRSRWLNKLMEAKNSSNSVGAVFAEAEFISSIHKRTGHFGVNRTLNFARKVIPTATVNDVREVHKICEPCQSVDPPHVLWEKEKLSVKENWERVAVNITYFGTEKFLTLVDCGPSIYALWR